MGEIPAKQPEEFKAAFDKAVDDLKAAEDRRKTVQYKAAQPHVQAVEDEEYAAAQNSLKAARWDGHLDKEGRYEEYFDDAAKEAADSTKAKPEDQP